MFKSGVDHIVGLNVVVLINPFLSMDTAERKCEKLWSKAHVDSALGVILCQRS